MWANHLGTWYKNVQASHMITSREPPGCRRCRRGILQRCSGQKHSACLLAHSVTNKNPLLTQGKRGRGKLSTITAKNNLLMRKIRSEHSIQPPKPCKNRASCHSLADPVACCPHKAHTKSSFHAQNTTDSLLANIE